MNFLYKVFIMMIVSASVVLCQIDILNKVKEKVDEKIEQKTDEKIDEGLEKIEKGMEGEEEESEDAEEKPVKKVKKQQSEEESEVSDEEESESGNTNKTVNIKKVKSPGDALFKRYAKYDFVPGEQVFFYDDFTREEIGNFPDLWNTNSGGEVLELEGFDGRWFRMQLGGTFYPEISGPLPENFTVEFDLLFAFNDVNESRNINLDFISTLPDESMDGLVPGSGGFQVRLAAQTLYTFNWKDASYSDIDITQENDYLETKNGEIVKVALMVQKQRVRVYLDEKKVFDVPRLVPKGLTLDRIRFFESAEESEDFNFFITNFRVAVGQPDIRSKLITEGKLVTRGIYFNSGSDVIKPESYGTLKEIAEVLKQNAGVKVKIIGHTDSDGSDQLNLELSKKRSAAVKNALSNDFGIDGPRMETDGMGESQPVGDNNSSEGKANNRRVEFIKL